MRQKKPGLPRLQTGVRNFDQLLGGGLPVGSAIAVTGPPGSGKTILAQQICFHAASPKAPILYFNTLSEPTAKTLRYLKQFSFFDARKFDRDFRFVDLGIIRRLEGLEQASNLITEQLRQTKPGIVVIDSFKTFDDLAGSQEELRKFGYEIAVKLMAWEANAFLLGEYTPSEFAANPLFSVVDGLIALSQRELSGEQQRFLQVLKMRGTEHSRNEHTFSIGRDGLEVYAPRVTILRQARVDEALPRCRTGIGKLDDLLGEGISRGSSLLISGVAGTGKTLMCLEFLYRGALAGEKGILFTFEETTERLLATARGMGWDLERQMEQGLLEIVFIPQPEIAVEAHLLMIQERVEALGARRVAVDSISVFLHKVHDPQISREKVFQIASVVQNVGAVGFLATDVPYGSRQLSRLGVEETVVDGVILLSATEEGLERHRYIEVYKLRNTAHLKGRHSLVIGRGGLQVFPRYSAETMQTPPLELGVRLTSGIPGLDRVLGGGLLRRSATFIAGSPGVGKTTFGMQFVLEGAALGEPGLLCTLEEGAEQLAAAADSLELPLGEWTGRGLLEVISLSRLAIPPARLLSILEDRIRERRVQRLFLDGVDHLMHTGPEDLRQLLQDLVMRFKVLDVTCVLSAESKSLSFGNHVTEFGLSPVTDNLLMLRYLLVDGEMIPALRVVKTRGSAHLRGVHRLEIGPGGLRVGDSCAGVRDGPG